LIEDGHRLAVGNATRTNLERATRKAEFHDAETTLQALSVT
jgi:hypothetical protein